LPGYGERRPANVRHHDPYVASRFGFLNADNRYMDARIDGQHGSDQRDCDGEGAGRRRFVDQ
jgi:hypothetical protein